MKYILNLGQLLENYLAYTFGTFFGEKLEYKYAMARGALSGG